MGETDNKDTAIQTAVDSRKEAELNNVEGAEAVGEADQSAHAEVSSTKTAKNYGRW